MSETSRWVGIVGRKHHDGKGFAQMVLMLEFVEEASIEDRQLP
jgi:hypothetical protein